LFDEHSASLKQPCGLHSVSGRYVPLLQIVSNLLINAAKYVPSGRRPEIEIWSEESPDGVLLHVKDNGRGISTADTESIFEPFVRLGENRAAGTGLGLSIARDAVETLGGSITLHSEEGAGSVFTVRLKPAAA
jgi:signal transduction histidine kinase